METESPYRTPGQLIAKLLEERGWTQRVLAVVLGIEETGLFKLVAGKKNLDAKMALKLGEVFGVPAETFLELQKSYDLAQARIVTIPDPGLANRVHLFGELPIADMIKRGWIEGDGVRDTKTIEKSLTKFFGATSPDEIEILPHAAKKTSVAAPATPAQIAWLYRVKEIASDLLVSTFSKARARGAIKKLAELRSAAEEARHAPRILAESGIRYVIVETLPGANIDGVCFWLDSKSPVIGMSIRYDRIDNFWFVLRHELEHLVQHHGQGAAMLDAELEGDRAGSGPSNSEEERIANEAAAEFCVPQKRIDSLIARKAPLFAERDILGFARTLQIHPGLVAGQLQNRTGRYDLFRNHLAKIRHIVAPSAIVDGWGYIAPFGNLGG